MAISPEAAAAKAEGNKYFGAKDYGNAIAAYTKAIEFEPKGPVSHTFFSNRSACYAAQENFESALRDGEKCVQLKPEWAKGYSRKGLALFKLRKFEEAKECYQTGLSKDPNNASLADGLQQCEKQLADAAAGGAGGGQKGLFGPEIWAQIHGHPELRQYASDADFQTKVNMLIQNPQAAMAMNVFTDPKIKKLFEVILGMKFDMGGADGAADEDTAMPDSTEAAATAGGDATAPAAKEDKEEVKQEEEPEVKQATPEPEETEEERQAREEKARKKKLAAEKKAEGNDLYQKKQLVEAMALYQEAAALDPTNPSYVLNQSAVLFMEEKWDECIAKCSEAIDVCRANFGELKWTFKAYSRMGSVEEKRQNFDAAVSYYKKALVEQKDDKLKRRVRAIEQRAKKKKEAEYLDPAKAVEHKTAGNDHFKAGRFREAIEEYTEAIKRDPKDHTLYSNRATAFCKIMQWDVALQDAETCVALNPDFIKAYIRQAKVYNVLKQFHKSLKVLRRAAEIDANNPDYVDTKRETMMAIQTRNMTGEVDEQARARALEDPDVKAAMNDPEVSSVLLQAQSGDNTILYRAMKDKPRIAEKIELLLAAGVLSMR